MTGSSYIPIVVPIMAFFAMAFWLGLVFYANSHPGYKRRKPQPVDDIVEPDAAGTAWSGVRERVGEHSSGPLAA